MQVQPAKPTPLVSIKRMQEKIQIRPSYQRGEVWSKEKRLKLIDSILKGKYIPEVLFTKPEDENYEEAVMDGQQRITTILRFMNNEIKLPKNYIIDGKNISEFTYEYLPEDIKDKVDSYALNIVRIYGSDEEIRDMFQRLQGGVSLNKVETRNAIGGKVKEFVKNEMLKDPFFKTSIGVTEKNNKRFKYDEVAEQIIVIEANNVSTDIKDKNIIEIYNKYSESGIPEEIKDSIMQKLNFLNNAFADTYKTILSKKINIINVYLVATEFIKNYQDYNNYAVEFANWYARFEENRKQQREIFRKTGECEKIYLEYFNAAAAGTGSKESLQGRKQVLMQSWEQWLKDIKEQSA